MEENPNKTGHRDNGGREGGSMTCPLLVSMSALLITIVFSLLGGIVVEWPGDNEQIVASSK